MKIVIAGKNSIAVNVLEHVNTLDHIEVSVILNRNENFKNGFQKSLGFYAKLWNIPILTLEDVYDEESLLFLSLEFDRIIKPEKFKSKKLYNIHFSLLPKYKGMYTSSLPILNGDSTTGVTLHSIDAGIDTGDILDRFEFPISFLDNARTLYEKYILHGTSIVLENLQRIIQNKIELKPQDQHSSTYFGRDTINYAELNINYKLTAYQIDRQLKAFTFREYQLPKFENEEIYNSIITNVRSNQKPGSIVSEDEYEIQLATIDYDIILFKDIYKKLWEACRNNDYDVLKDIFENCELDIELRNENGWNALIIAVYNNSIECVNLLIDYGANINASNYNGTTVLMYAKSSAILTHDHRVLNTLLTLPIDIHKKDVYDKSILDWLKDEDTELYSLLKEWSAASE